MRKSIFIPTILIILLFFGCNADSTKGILQSVHDAADKESAYNQMYLGVDSDNGYVYLYRDNDIYRVHSVDDDDDGDYKLVYQKLVELSTAGKDYAFVPIGYNEDNLYFARKDSGLYVFFYVPVSDCEDGAITLRDYSYSSQEISFGDDISVDTFSVTRHVMDTLQFIFSIEDDDSAYFALTDVSNLSTSAITLDELGTENTDTYIEVPVNASTIGLRALRVYTDDPEIDELKDNVNLLYLISEEGELQKIYVKGEVGSGYYAFGSDGEYAAFMDGRVYKIDFYDDDTDSSYAGELNSKTIFSFDTYKRWNNYLILYDDGENIVGYICENGLYWREDYGTPKLKLVSDDANVVPSCFLGHRTNSYGYVEYLMLTQDNGFYVVEPKYHKATSRSFITKIDNKSSDWALTDFI